MAINRGITSKILKNNIKLPEGQSGIMLKSFPCRGVLLLSDYIKDMHKDNIVTDNKNNPQDIQSTYEPDSMLGLIPVYYSGISFNEGIDIVTVERLHTKAPSYMEYKLVIDIDKLNLDDSALFQNLFTLYNNINCIDFSNIAIDNIYSRLLITTILNYLPLLNKKCSLIFGGEQYTESFVNSFRDMMLLGTPNTLNIDSISLSDSLLIGCFNDIKDFSKWICQLKEIYVFPSGEFTELTVDYSTNQMNKTAVYIDTTNLSKFYKKGIINPFVCKALGDSKYIVNISIDINGRLSDISSKSLKLLSKSGINLSEVYYNIFIDIPAFLNQAVSIFNIDIAEILSNILGYELQDIEDNVLSIGTWDFLVDIKQISPNKYNLIVSNNSNEIINIIVNGLISKRILLSSAILDKLNTLYYETDKYTVCSLGDITDMRLKYLIK